MNTIITGKISSAITTLKRHFCKNSLNPNSFWSHFYSLWRKQLKRRESETNSSGLNVCWMCQQEAVCVAGGMDVAERLLQDQKTSQRKQACAGLSDIKLLFSSLQLFQLTDKVRLALIHTNRSYVFFTIVIFSFIFYFFFAFWFQ